MRALKLLGVVLMMAATSMVASSTASAARVSTLTGGTITNVELVGTSLVVHGQLSAQDWQCLADRTVVLDRPGPRQVAHATTNQGGYWTISVHGFSNVKKVSLWAWAKSTGKRGSLLCEGGAATRTVLYLPAVTRQYTQILNSTRSVLRDTDRLVELTGTSQVVQPVLRDEGHAVVLMDKAQHDASIFAARADVARARWYAAEARREAAVILGL
jgi:hypothetical protein